jgi:hypothetical protein
MGRWRAIWIAGGVLAVGAVCVFVFVQPKRVSAQVFGETNGHRTVIIRNPSAHPYYVTAWGEFYANDAWERLSLSNAFRKVEPESFIKTEVLMPTNKPKRVVFVYRPIKQRGPGFWLEKAKARLRLKPLVEFEYIEVE